MSENDKTEPQGEPEPSAEQPAETAELHEDGEAPRRSRYQVIWRDEQRYIVCGNAPNLLLHVEAGLVVNETGRKQYPEQTIFLDGVYAGPPFYDNKARQYSLDHHVGCVRAYTLATCEQAVVLLLQGLPLGEKNWTIYVNEPDLDAALAAWTLMNHVELLREDGRILREAMPLIRVEGVIDAHGSDMAVLTALPPEEYEKQKQNVDRLRSRERSLKAAGQWNMVDWVSYTRDLLEAVDQLVFPEDYLSELLEIVELGRVPIYNGQKFAILCRSHQGIYAVETALKARYEKQVGIIVLDLGGGRFTLRQVDPFLDQDLTGLYVLLNQKDLRARQENETDNLWGGSGDIGGSPRRTGSALTGPQILQLIQQVYGGEPGWLARIFRRVGGR